MNRCILLNLPHRSGVHMSPQSASLLCIPVDVIYIKSFMLRRGCMKDEVYTHPGVSQDSRAGNGH